jgi:hypothetical protein
MMVNSRGLVVVGWFGALGGLLATASNEGWLKTISAVRECGEKSTSGI